MVYPCDEKICDCQAGIEIRDVPEKSSHLAKDRNYTRSNLAVVELQDLDNT